MSDGNRDADMGGMACCNGLRTHAPDCAERMTGGRFEAPAAPPRPSCPGIIETVLNDGWRHCPGCAPHASEAGRLTEEEREWVETTRALVARITAPSHTMHAAYLAQMVRIIDRLTSEPPR